jgi:hypothetical protein
MIDIRLFRVIFCRRLYLKMRAGSTNSMNSIGGPRSQVRPPPYTPRPKPRPFLPPRSLFGVSAVMAVLSSFAGASTLMALMLRSLLRPRPHPRPLRPPPQLLARSRICDTNTRPLLGANASHSCAVKFRVGSDTSIPFITCVPLPRPGCPRPPQPLQFPYRPLPRPPRPARLSTA